MPLSLDAERAAPSGVSQHAQRAEQARHIHAAVGHVAGAGVARQIVELVHVERAAEQAHQQRVAGRQRAVARRVDEIGDTRRVETP